MGWKKNITIDFESVIAPRSGNGITEIRKAIHRLREDGYRIDITSPRCADLVGTSVVEDFLTENGIEFDYVRCGFPPCLCYIANNAISFNGDVDDLLTRIATIKD